MMDLVGIWKGKGKGEGNREEKKISLYFSRISLVFSFPSTNLYSNSRSRPKNTV